MVRRELEAGKGKSSFVVILLIIPIQAARSEDDQQGAGVLGSVCDVVVACPSRLVAILQKRVGVGKNKKLRLQMILGLERSSHSPLRPPTPHPIHLVEQEPALDKAQKEGQGIEGRLAVQEEARVLAAFVGRGHAVATSHSAVCPR